MTDDTNRPIFITAPGSAPLPEHEAKFLELFNGMFQACIDECSKAVIEMKLKGTPEPHPAIMVLAAYGALMQFYIDTGPNAPADADKQRDLLNGTLMTCIKTPMVVVDNTNPPPPRTDNPVKAVFTNPNYKTRN